jgi:predicted DNA-binding protein with PD1-like motif
VKYSEARPGRIFVIRLEDGDMVHEAIETFAREQGVSAAAVIALGGADGGSHLVAGPEDGQAEKIIPLIHALANVHEAAGVGTIFPDAAGNPVLHMHMACGRRGDAATGCVRAGVKVWQVMEVVVFELTDTQARRLYDAATGFDLLVP